MSVRVQAQPDGSLLLSVKVVPGASRERIIGEHGEALRVATSAPPEAGKANKAVCKLLAGALGLPARNVTIHAGPSRPFKTLRIEGVSEAELRGKLGL